MSEKKVPGLTIAAPLLCYALGLITGVSAITSPEDAAIKLLKGSKEDVEALVTKIRDPEAFKAIQKAIVANPENAAILTGALNEALDREMKDVKSTLQERLQHVDRAAEGRER